MLTFLSFLELSVHLAYAAAAARSNTYWSKIPPSSARVRLLLQHLCRARPGKISQVVAKKIHQTLLYMRLDRPRLILAIPRKNRLSKKILAGKSARLPKFHSENWLFGVIFREKLQRRSFRRNLVWKHKICALPTTNSIKLQAC